MTTIKGNFGNRNRLFNGTKCKIRLGNHRFSFQKKMGVNFFIRKKTIPGGGVRGGVWQKTIRNTFFFLEPFPYGCTQM